MPLTSPTLLTDSTLLTGPGELPSPPQPTPSPPPEVEPVHQTSLFTLIHYDHSGRALGEVIAEQPHWSITLSRPETITYEIDLGHKLANPAYTTPYATDFVFLKNGNPLFGGLHTEINVSDVTSNMMEVSGQGWLHYLDRRQWPFDPLDPIANLYTAFQHDMFAVIEEILGVVLSQPGSLVLSFNNGTAGIPINYRIEAGDIETMLSKVETLSKTRPGFDYEITLNHEFKMYTPQRNNFLQGLVMEQGTNISTISYADKGPGGTHLLGLGAGSASKVGRIYDDGVSEQFFRRLDVAVDFGELADENLISSLTQAEGQRQSLPVRPISVKWLDDTQDIWQLARPGDSCIVRGDAGYDMIDDTYRIVGMEGNVTTEGDEEVTLTFDDGTLSL